MRQIRKKLRSKFRPASANVLFLGESPPANGTFFYSENSNLWKYTRQAFANVYGPAFPEGVGFCEFFKSLGCYLEDLCLDPVNKLTKPEIKNICKESIESLASRISDLYPKTIVCIKKSILPHIREVVRICQFQDVPLYSLPFPAFGHQPKYLNGLSDIIRELQKKGIIRH